MKNHKILFSFIFALLFTLTQAQHQHGFGVQNAERVKEVMFGNLHAKIYLPKIEIDQEFDLRVEVQDMETHSPPENVKVFLNIRYLHLTREDNHEISATRELEMTNPGNYFVKEKLSQPGKYDLTLKLVDERSGAEKEVVFEVELSKRKNFLESMMDMHGTMMYGAIGLVIMIIMMAVKFIF